ncbi:DMT family transporter [Lichenibacterium ramalinae]|uniref:DMT family transporter n=1 Tax=Lichenibacterium ramalinae TaxID=2316527 RepID=A0A4Q2RF87_9HYPH|nr:DMT family transporter [Lichenibacterium ramalinae]RYB05006.1 DMT family transporter [Lichenibacterium ramalinae]
MSNSEVSALPSPAATPAAVRALALRPRLAFGMVVLMAAALAMSISPSLVRLADVGSFASAFWRVALALPLLWAWMRHDEAKAGAAARRVSFARPTVLAGLVFAGDLMFWHMSVMRTTVANATFFATCAPIWVVLFGWLLLGHRVGRPVLVGLGFCVAGGAALVAQSFAFDPAHAPGDGLAIVTGVFFGLYFLAVAAARDHAGAARVTFELSLVASGVLLVLALALEPQLIPRGPAGWGVLLTLAVVSHAGGQGLLSVALGLLPASFSSLVIFLEAVAAAGVAWAVLGEAVSPVQALGGLAILAGIWIARPRSAAPSPAGAPVPAAPLTS